ncbi:MAG: hypothetical protein IJX67_07530 [Oscillospiraceae bacterium]|nr:hypothetical protein [Oscillospiraceae bacterium]
MKQYIELIRKYSKENYLQMTREPDGILKYPFVVPGSQSYSDSLWDWDSWLANIAIRQIMEDNGDSNQDFFEYEKGCILNFLEHTTAEGKMPIFITPKTMLPEMDDRSESNIHKPCIAQHAAFIIGENGGECGWIRPYFSKLERYIDYYMNHMRHKETGLFFWQNDMAVGVDNDPSIFYRPDKSSASIYLNCMMYKELMAMAYLCKLLGIHADKYQSEAEQLKSAVQEHLWDERNGFYYSADLNLKPIDKNQWLHSGMPRHWHCLIQRIDGWSGFMAMWAGIATKEQAERMVKENLLKPELFNGQYGIRTLAKTEKMYCNVKSGNPSCWLGPVWGISNYMCYRGLMNYGFLEEAKELAQKTIKLFGQDLEKCGEFHEYYHPDTGEGINNPGFQNWNLLVNNMIAELEGKRVVVEF